MPFRSRLCNIKTEKILWEYFEKYASYDEQSDVYICAGLFSDDTRKLWFKLVKEWKVDVLYEAKRLLGL